MRKPKLDGYVFLPAVLIIGSVAILLMIYPEKSREISTVMLAAISYDFGAFAQWVVLLGTGWLLWLAMSKYGNVKLGGFDDKPEFSTFSWISLMITAGIGMSLMIMAMVEPVSNIDRTPLGIMPKTMTAIDWSVAFGMFHWGFSGWALYSISGVTIAYAYHVRKIPYLKGSVACGGILGNYVNSWLGKIIDLVIVLGLVGGVATTLGIIVPVLSELITDISGIKQSLRQDGLVVLVCTMVAAYTVYLGLHRGMEKLAAVNAWASLGLTLFVVVVGPTAFLISFFGQSMGVMFQNYIAMSTYMDAFNRNTWAGEWTIFYWAWWASFSIYMGLFIARISKGRTIRQMVMGSLIVPSMVCFFVFMAFGGYAIYQQNLHQIDLVWLLRMGGSGAVVGFLLKTLPFHNLIMPIFIIIGIISMATEYQGSAYCLASIATEKLYAGEDPAAWHRLTWALINGFFGFAVVMLNDFNVVKLVSVISLVPILIIIIILTLSFMRWIRVDFATSRISEMIILNVPQKIRDSAAKPEK